MQDQSAVQSESATSTNSTPSISDASKKIYDSILADLKPSQKIIMLDEGNKEKPDRFVVLDKINVDEASLKELKDLLYPEYQFKGKLRSIGDLEAWSAQDRTTDGFPLDRAAGIKSWIKKQKISEDKRDYVLLPDQIDATGQSFDALQVLAPNTDSTRYTLVASIENLKEGTPSLWFKSSQYDGSGKLIGLDR